jgi:DNA-binding NarL/FixJ family response regulator
LRVALAEDGMLFREGVSRLLGEAGFEVTARCENAEELLREIDAHPPDVAIVDIRMPPTHTDEGLRAALEIRERHPSVGVLVLSQYVEPGLAMRLLADSVEGVGYLLKERVGEVRAFVDAVERVAGGGTALDREVVAELMRSREGHADDAALAELTPREREVLGFMAEGRTNAAIARAMVVTPGAVEKHISSIFGKLDLPSTNDDHRRVLAVLAYLRAGSND